MLLSPSQVSSVNLDIVPYINMYSAENDLHNVKFGPLEITDNTKEKIDALKNKIEGHGSYYWLFDNVAINLDVVYSVSTSNGHIYFSYGGSTWKSSELTLEKAANIYTKYLEHVKEREGIEEERDAPAEGKGAGLEDDEVLEASRQGIVEMVGLREAKGEIQNNVALARLNEAKREMNIPVQPASRHMVFTGNPGTGKTTFAREVAHVYFALGLIDSPEVVEVRREDLVAKFIGQTEAKVKEVIQKAQGKILFIDEAYTLINGSENDYGKVVIDTLLATMENNRDNFIVIVAGYSEKMQKFIDSNPGMKSRFTTFINFEDYSITEMGQILDKMLKQNGSKMAPETRAAALEKLEQEKLKCERLDKKKGLDPSFGNGRTVRNLVEQSLKLQAGRLSAEGILGKKRGGLSNSAYKEALRTITLDDVQKASLEGIKDKKPAGDLGFSASAKPQQAVIHP